MPHYKHGTWVFAVSRFSYRLANACDRAAQWVVDEDFAAQHYDGRGATRTETLRAWLGGFARGWRDAPSEGQIDGQGLFAYASNGASDQAGDPVGAAER